MSDGVSDSGDLASTRIKRTTMMVKMSLLLAMMLCVSNCAANLWRVSDWSYRQPPTEGTTARVPNGGVWCDSAAKAQVMATTGFFIYGCSSLQITAGAYKVIEIEHITQNDVNSWIVKIADANNHFLWIPLPDHNWA